MAVGDISIDTFTIGGLNATDPSQVTLVGFNIYEDILNILGPVAEVHLGDTNDALGQFNITGSQDQDVTISFSVPQTSTSATYKFKMSKNKDLNDQSDQGKGSMHSKFYTFKFVSPESLLAQSNVDEKSYSTTTAEIAKDILTNNFKTTKNVQIDSPTNGVRIFRFSQDKHPIDRLKIINTQHVSTKNKSSCYVTFQTLNGGNQVYKITEFEELFKQSPVATLTQTSTLGTTGTTDDNKQNSITWFKVEDSFDVHTRALNNVTQKGYDATTGTNNVKTTPPAPKFTTLGKPLYDFTSNPAIPSAHSSDAINNKTPTGLADAKANRLKFLAHLSQNSADLEIMGNPAITLGSVVELVIPKKASFNNGDGESQFNGKALVVAIRHKVRPIGQSPRYTMILKVIKAGIEEGCSGIG